MRDLYAGTAAGPLGLAMVIATWAGSGWSMLAILPLLAVKRTRRFGLGMIATLLVAATAVFALKALVRRPRPFVTLLGIAPLSGAPTDFSFPSGHATGSATFAAFLVASIVLAWRRGLLPETSRGAAITVGAVAVSFALMVAASRVYLGVHYPGDVGAGMLLGTLIGTSGAVWYRRALSGPVA